jgi:hypothetical protein
VKEMRPRLGGKQLNDTFIQIAAGGVIVTAVGAVTFVAYNHPKSYKKLFFVLVAIISTLTVSCAIWNVSNLVAANAAVDSGYVKDDKIKDMYRSVEYYSTPIYFVAILGAANLYLCILLTLPWWLLDEKP